MIREAEANGEAHCNRGSESRVAVRQALWEAHMQSRVSALEEALKRTEAGAERASKKSNMQGNCEGPALLVKDVNHKLK